MSSVCTPTGPMGILVARIIELLNPVIPDGFYRYLLESADCFWTVTLGPSHLLVALAYRLPGCRNDWLHDYGLDAALVEPSRTRALHAGHIGGIDIYLVDGVLESLDGIFEVRHWLASLGK